MTKNPTNKYGAKSKKYNGVTYHSILEADYARNLDLMIRAGEILKWERQVKFDLRAYGKHITNYYLDFIITHLDGSKEYVEVKGFATKEWKIKFDMFVALIDHEKPGAKVTIHTKNGKFAARFRPIAPHKYLRNKPLPRRYA